MKNEIDKRYNPANETMKYQFFIELEHSKEGKDFDYNELDTWFKNHNYTCFMSEYEAPHKCILEIKKESLFNNSNLEKRKFVFEKLYWNEVL